MQISLQSLFKFSIMLLCAVPALHPVYSSLHHQERVFRSSFLFALLPTSQMNFRLHFLLAGVCILIYVNETIASSSSKKRPPAMSGLQSGVWPVGTVWMLTDCLLNDIIGICGVWVTRGTGFCNALSPSLSLSLSLSISFAPSLSCALLRNFCHCAAFN